MDLIAQALARREKLKAELDRVEAFLSMAYELQGEKAEVRIEKPLEDKIAEPVGRSPITRAPAGIGARTAEIAVTILREAGNPMSTRDLVPLVEAHEIEIGGKDPVATLSARLSNYAKMNHELRLVAGRWHLLEWIGDADKEEAADTPSKDASAASLFTTNQGERRDAAALVN